MKTNFNLLEYLENNPIESQFLYQKKYLLFLILFVTIWQSFFYFGKVQVTSEYRRADATGFNHWWGQNFVYFYYYLDLFPLTTTDTNLVYSKTGAWNVIKKHPLSLRMEWNHWARFGESARIWLYMPYAFLTSSAQSPQIIFTNYIIFLVVLITILIISWINRKIVLGIITTIILGNSPFLLYEIYNNNNIFGLMAVYFVFLLLIHLPIIWATNTKWIYIIPFISGIIIGVMHNIRAESSIMFLSCFIVYLFSKNKIFQKISLIFISLLTFYATNKSIQLYFKNKYLQTYQIVKKYNGVPFEGDRTAVHPLWHPLLCGLGDYDNKYDFKLHDTDVYNRILPILRKIQHKELRYPGNSIYSMDEYYDSLGFYYKKPETINGYDSIAKQIFLSSIKKDPLWYGNILIKRLRDFLFHLSPIGIGIYSKLITIPVSGWFNILFILLLSYFNAYRFLSIILFTMPLGFSVILVYSKYNNSYQSIYHLFSICFIIYIIIGWIYNNREALKNFLLSK